MRESSRVTCLASPRHAITLPGPTHPMYRSLAREKLNQLWALVASSRERALSEEERKELARLCSILQGQPGVTNEVYKERVDELCLSLHSGAAIPAASSDAKLEA